jgi:hypothetical protein
MKNSLFIFCTAILSLLINPLKAQETTVSVTLAGQANFTISKPKVTITLSPDGQITGFNILEKGRLSYDLNNRITEAGSTRISYDLSGRISEIAGERVSYNFDGQVDRFGDTRVSYNLSDKVSEIGSQRISYNLDGKVSEL